MNWNSIYLNVQISVKEAKCLIYEGEERKKRFDKLEKLEYALDNFIYKKCLIKLDCDKTLKDTNGTIYILADAMVFNKYGEENVKNFISKFFLKEPRRADIKTMIDLNRKLGTHLGIKYFIENRHNNIINS